MQPSVFRQSLSEYWPKRTGLIAKKGPPRPCATAQIATARIGLSRGLAINNPP